MKKLIMGLALLTSLAASAADECSIYLERDVMQADLEASFEENMILKGYHVVEKKEDAKYRFRLFPLFQDHMYGLRIAVKTQNQEDTSIFYESFLEEEDNSIFHESFLEPIVTLGFAVNKIKDCY